MNSTIQILNIALVAILFVIFLLGAIALIILLRIKNKKSNASGSNAIIKSNYNNTEKDTSKMITRKGESIDSIYRFMEFDSIVDQMIVRKNGQQYIMVLECKGINYDLLSEDEKEGVEAGFIALLNTLRFPIQLYVQTRTLDLREMINKYSVRTNEMKDQIIRLNAQMQGALNRGDSQTAEKLQREKNRKQNIFEYGKSIEEYTSRISENKNILQQKTYIIVSYYPSEYGDLSKYSKEEISDIAFSELYTRCQSLRSALMAAEVTSRALTSEELAELVYVAYNRDSSEVLTLKNALDSEYDRLYSTARDVIEEKKKKIEDKIEQDALKVARKSLIKADEEARLERKRRVKERAKEMVDEVKDQISVPLYTATKKEIDNANIDEIIGEKTHN